MALIAVLVPLCLALISLAGWISYLIFCNALVKRTNKSESLKHAAEAARGYREGTGSALAEVLSKILALRRR
jgi:hypothetical protein